MICKHLRTQDVDRRMEEGKASARAELEEGRPVAWKLIWSKPNVVHHTGSSIGRVT